MKINNFLIVTICILLTACTTDVVRDQDATMTNNTEYGYVAFSTVCKNTPKVFMYYDDRGMNFIRTVTQGSSTASIKLTCDISTPQYFLLKLPTGKYAIRGFGLTDVPTKTFADSNFKVLSKQVVYIGRITVTANPNKEFFSDFKYGYLKASIVDEHLVDLPLFAQMYKNIPASSYIVVPPEVRGTTTGFVREMLEVR